MATVFESFRGWWRGVVCAPFLTGATMAAAAFPIDLMNYMSVSANDPFYVLAAGGSVVGQGTGVADFARRWFFLGCTPVTFLTLPL